MGIMQGQTASGGFAASSADVATDAATTVVDAAGGGSVAVPDVGLLMHGRYVRLGPDLMIVGPDGQQVLVTDYFTHETPPDLMGPGGMMIQGATATALAGPRAPAQVAQAAFGETELAQAAEAIGTVTKLTGTVFVQRADGSRAELTSGDQLLQGDIIETAADGAVGVTFADGTEMSLGGDGRLVLDEMIYDPDSGSGESSFSLVSGAFSFVSGQIAKSGPDAMQIKTPVATIGIRGTKGVIKVGAFDTDGDGEIDSQIEVALLDSGEIVIRAFNGVTQTLNEVNTGFRVVQFSGSDMLLGPAEGRVEGFQVTREFFGDDTVRASLSHLPPAEVPNFDAAPPPTEPLVPDLGPEGPVMQQQSGLEQFVQVVLRNSELRQALGLEPAPAGASDGEQTLPPILDGRLGGEQPAAATTTTGTVTGTGTGTTSGDSTDTSEPTTQTGTTTTTQTGSGTESGTGTGSGTGGGTGTGSTTDPYAGYTQITVSGGIVDYSSSTSNLLIWGSSSSDDVTTGSGSDLIYAGAGNDHIYTGAGNDKVYAGSGADTVVGGTGAGDDYYHGGDESGDDSTQDTLLFTSASDGVIVDLALGHAHGTQIGIDTLVGFEHVVSGIGDDQLKGNAAANMLEAGAGADRLLGRGGNDTLMGGAGNDTYIYLSADPSWGNDVIQDSGGADVIDFTQATDHEPTSMQRLIYSVGIDYSSIGAGYDPAIDNVDVNLNGTLYTATSGTAGISTLADALNAIAAQILTTHPSYTVMVSGDTLTVDSGSTGEVLSIALAGTSDGAAHLIVNSSDLLLTTDAGTITIRDGEGAGRVEAMQFYDQSAETTVTYTFATVHGGMEGNYNEIVIGDDRAETLYGYDGEDALFGNGGDDYLDGGVGSDDDYLAGGAGNDTYNFSASMNGGYWGSDDVYDTGGTDKIIVDATLIDAQTTSEGLKLFYEGGSEIWVEGTIESYAKDSSNYALRLAAAGPTGSADLFIGTGGDDSMNGMGGADLVVGGVGADTLTGGDSSNDTLIGGYGNDFYTFVGGSIGYDRVIDIGGSDTVSISDATLADVELVSSNLVLTTNSSETITVEGHTASARSVETIAVGSNSYTVRTDTGGAGNDILVASLSATHLTADGGNDMVFGGDTGYTIDGGAGNDTLRSGIGDDLYAFASRGSGDVDTVIDAGGTDTISFQGIGAGGMPVTVLRLDGVLTISFADGGSITAYGIDEIIDHDGNIYQTIPANLEFAGQNDFVLGTTGNDTINLADGNDWVFGNGGTDTYVLTPTMGHDTLVAAGGQDTIDINGLTLSDGVYDSVTGMATLSFGSNSVSFRAPNAFTYLDGGLHWDILTPDQAGDINQNLIIGSSSNDALYGNGGNDKLLASGGDDLLYGGDGNDVLTGGDGNDTLYGEADNDSLDGGGGNDLLVGGDGDDVLTGGEGNDTLAGGTGVDYLSGGAGNDLLVISDTGDTLVGGDGFDLIAVTGTGTTSLTSLSDLQTISTVEGLLLGGGYVSNLRVERLGFDNLFGSVGYVRGGAGTTVTTGPSEPEWTYAGSTSLDGVSYLTFTETTRTLHVEVGTDISGLTTPFPLWTGAAADGNFETAGNWLETPFDATTPTNPAPTTEALIMGADVTFGAVQSGEYVVGVVKLRDGASLTVQGGTLTTDAIDGADVSSGSTFTSDLTINAGTVGIGSGTSSVGNLTMTGGTISGGGTLNVNGTASSLSGTVQLEGSLYFYGASHTVDITNATIVGNQVLDATSTSGGTITDSNVALTGNTSFLYGFNIAAATANTSVSAYGVNCTAGGSVSATTGHTTAITAYDFYSSSLTTSGGGAVTIALDTSRGTTASGYIGSGTFGTATTITLPLNENMSATPTSFDVVSVSYDAATTFNVGDTSILDLSGTSTTNAAVAINQAESGTTNLGGSWTLNDTVTITGGTVNVNTDLTTISGSGTFDLSEATLSLSGGMQAGSIFLADLNGFSSVTRYNLNGHTTAESADFLARSGGSNVLKVDGSDRLYLTDENYGNANEAMVGEWEDGEDWEIMAATDLGLTEQDGYTVYHNLNTGLTLYVADGVTVSDHGLEGNV